MACRNLRASIGMEMDNWSCNSEVSDISQEYRTEDSSDESEQILTRHMVGKRLKTSSSTKEVKRLPTRRPDPNTYNRNALMARENRKKKKEYLESLEKQVTYYKSINKKLKNMLRHQSKISDRLRNESKYYRSILANKTQIISLVNAVKNVNLPCKDSGYASESRSLMPILGESLCDSNENGTDILTDPFLSVAANNYISTDYNCLQNQIQSWEDLLESDELIFPNFSDEIEPSRESQKRVIDEHNYSNSHSDEDLDDPGVCLHVSSGNISLKFCASCHQNTEIGLESTI